MRKHVNVTSISSGYVKVHDVDTTILDKEYVVLEGYEPVEDNKPHLINNAKCLGEMGETTNFKDVIGRPLYIGDTVELYDCENRYCREHPIVKDRDSVFVMGIRGVCNNDGTIKGGWKIIKKRNYYDVEDGEIVGKVKYVGKCNG